MNPNVLFAASADRWPAFEHAIPAALDKLGIECRFGSDIPSKEVDYIVYAPNGPISDFSQFPNAKAVLSLWAGVEKIVGNETLQTPLTRMVDAGLSEGMVEWVAGHVLRHHLGIDAQILNQDGVWSPIIPPLARHRTVGVLGLGELGSACAKALAGLNFRVLGWSRTLKDVDAVDCFFGREGLDHVLGACEILILLLPLTEATENLLNQENIKKMPRGSVVLNPGRGQLIDDCALLEALDTGQISHATLDVFRTEPLPAGNRFWSHPNVTVTPHIASETRSDTAAQVIAENIRRIENGEAPLFLVDRESGY